MQPAPRFERADAVGDGERQRGERVVVERIELGDRRVEVVEAELVGAGAGLAHPDRAQGDGNEPDGPVEWHHDRT